MTARQRADANRHRWRRHRHVRLRRLRQSHLPGIYFQRARYYNQQRGRFLTVDPFGGFPSKPETLHKYIYANADSVNRIDPSGLATIVVDSAFNRQIVPITRDATIAIGLAVLCKTIHTASIIAPESFSNVQPLLSYSPCIENWETVTVYRGLQGTSPSEFKGAFDPDGFSTYEILYKKYKFVLPFRIRYRKPKVFGTRGWVMNSPIAGVIAIYGGEGDPTIGKHHWLIQFPHRDDLPGILSKFGKANKAPVPEFPTP